MRREFHDLSERLLNHESGGTTAWGNLGYWDEAQSYPQACTALADALGRQMALSPDTRLLDVGFGCGDQILHWIDRYGLRDIAGLNLSHSQTAFARHRLRQRGLDAVAGHLQVGDAAELERLPHRLAGGAAPNAIIALDCAYHFNTRARFLRQAARVLAADGRIGLTDLVLGDHALHPGESAALTGFARLSRIPRANLVTLGEYRRRWEAAGFSIESLSDISAQVMPAFGRWLRAYRAAHRQGTPRRRWLKYGVTAAFLRWAWRGERLRYIVCTGRLTRRSTSG